MQIKLISSCVVIIKESKTYLPKMLLSYTKIIFLNKWTKEYELLISSLAFSQYVVI